MPKTRLDKLLVERGLAESRERAQALILAGQVLVADQVVSKAGAAVDPQAELRLRGEVLPYVSRGGLKLAHALDHFGLSPAGLRALDVGASTGGFSDVLLQRGAAAVCALDVGYGQLAWKLRQDPRVTSLERLNIRTLEPSLLPFRPQAITCDVSFISLALVLPKLVELAAEVRWLVCLVKPQFEVGKGEVGKGGVVREEAKRLATVERIVECARALGCTTLGWTTSPITGPAGNVEYLLALLPPPSETPPPSA